MQVRLTTEADLERVMEIYHGAQAFMAAHGNPTQWRNAYPTPEIVREDIALCRGYVCEENGHLYAAFMLLEEEDPNYRRIDGAWLNDLPYQTLHRVASSGERKGMTDFIVQWALKRCPNLRGDTHADNLPMQRAFERNGFRRCGIVWMQDGTERIAYQRPPKTKGKLIVIAGTNASGKSALGVEVAKRFGGEIVSADSRQVYRGMNLGSGKITPEEMQGVTHHLIDVVEPGEFFSMADFQRLAYEAIDDILARGKVPFLVGGTGLYVNAVADGYQLSGTMPDLSYRRELEKLTTPELYALLMQKRPASDVEPNNRNRVMRVLEKLHDGDDTAPTKHPRYDCLRLGVTWPREVLGRRIDERMTRRFQEGMIQEVRGLMECGISEEFLLKLGLEYKLITQYLTGVIPTEEELSRLLSIAIKQFAKRQMTWFRRDGAIHWLRMDRQPVEEACALITEFLAK
ncbi:MAG: tRNA (adenosine(37)-N6)-dimethylallyltransferase MiaA [Clostridiales bacterium]|nr:tRNA (adenosine(37)-N6)-dimethylallyltransferase MiaA [Clostridiales bacterium]